MTDRTGKHQTEQQAAGAAPAVVSILAAKLRDLILGGEEHVVLDVREEVRFEKSHLFWAINLPLSQLELLIEARVPRRGVRIVLIDELDGLVEHAAARLSRFGYTNLAILEGGVAGWRDAGFALYRGLNVPSKAFGEFVEHAYGTEHIEAKELKALQDAKADLVILDSRTLPEFTTRSIPGGVACPGAELTYRAHQYVKSPSTLVVVNCAGRTRSIIGAQSLINAGLPNRVVALKDGTMGWHLSGLKVATGETVSVAAPEGDGLVKARAAAEKLQQRFGVRHIDEAKLEQFRKESDQRALYVFDVRQPAEYAAGHRPGVRHAEGGQLVQATDLYVGIRNARIVLTDDNGVRATHTAAWLNQIGWLEVYVLDGGLGQGALEKGPEQKAVLGLDEAAVDAVTPAELHKLLDAGSVTVVDVQYSDAYIDGHIPGAWFAIRSRLPQDLARLPRFENLVFTSSDGKLATLAAQDLKGSDADLHPKRVRVLKGGTAAWVAAGLPLEQGDAHLASTADDIWVKPANRRTDAEAGMNDYLQWETDLVRQIEADKDVSFKRFA